MILSREVLCYRSRKACAIMQSLYSQLQQYKANIKTVIFVNVCHASEMKVGAMYRNVLICKESF